MLLIVLAFGWHTWYSFQILPQGNLSTYKDGLAMNLVFVYDCRIIGLGKLSGCAEIEPIT